MEGIINFFKPEGMTSHDAVYLFRRLLVMKKVGHTGTLDPMATGVLPICIGKGTKVSDYLSNVDKEYIAEMTLGVKTDTQDSTGKVIETSLKEVSKDEIISCFEGYIGDIEQTPPMFSAKKINGKKLYDLARKGIEVQRKKNKITIKKLEIINIIDNKRVIFKVLCSKGTYVRTLCNDIGEDLGTYGHMSYLLRSRVADYDVNSALGMETLKSMTKDELVRIIQPLDSALTHLPEMQLDSSFFKPLSNGVKLEIDNTDNLVYNNPIRVYVGGVFLGIGKVYTDNDKVILKMEKVFNG